MPICITRPDNNPCYYPPPDEVGAGGIGAASDVRSSSVRPASAFSFSEQNPSMDFCNFWHTHPLGGADVPFGFFEILPT